MDMVHRAQEASRQTSELQMQLDAAYLRVQELVSSCRCHHVSINSCMLPCFHASIPRLDIFAGTQDL